MRQNQRYEYVYKTGLKTKTPNPILFTDYAFNCPDIDKRTPLRRSAVHFHAWFHLNGLIHSLSRKNMHLCRIIFIPVQNNNAIWGCKNPVRSMKALKSWFTILACIRPRLLGVKFWDDQGNPRPGPNYWRGNVLPVTLRPRCGKAVTVCTVCPQGRIHWQGLFNIALVSLIQYCWIMAATKICSCCSSVSS